MSMPLIVARTRNQGDVSKVMVRTMPSFTGEQGWGDPESAETQSYVNKRSGTEQTRLEEQ
jgi:hypothetical protein